MIRMSHRAIIEDGRRFNGLYFTGNIYEYENCIEMLQMLRKSEEQTCTVLLYNEKLEQLKKDYPTIKYISAKQIGYSCGIYGCTGQLHMLDLFDKDNNLLAVLYAYC